MDVDAESEEILNADSFKCELNTLSRADGSSVLCQNNTVMAAAVYGPVEVKHHKMLIDKAHIEVIYKPKCGLSRIDDRLYESIIGRICETAVLTSFYPRTAIYLITQELQDCGATLACSINATCLALIHAGIAMTFLFAAVTCEVSSGQNHNSHFEVCILCNGPVYGDVKMRDFKDFTLFAALFKREQSYCYFDKEYLKLFRLYSIKSLLLKVEYNKQKSKSEITFVFENTSDRILAVDSYGAITEAEYQNCLKKCRSSSGVIFEFYKNMIRKYAIKM